jgi:hypothetical protein
MTMRVPIGSQYPPQLRKNTTVHQVAFTLLLVATAQVIKPRRLSDVLAHFDRRGVLQNIRKPG